jgi:hypothetical protein
MIRMFITGKGTTRRVFIGDKELSPLALTGSTEAMVALVLHS